MFTEKWERTVEVRDKCRNKSISITPLNVTVMGGRLLSSGGKLTLNDGTSPVIQLTVRSFLVMRNAFFPEPD